MDDKQKRQLFNLLMFTGLVICAVAVTFAATIYQVMVPIDENLAYMALYYDAMGAELYMAGGSYDAIVIIQAQAMRYCNLYLAEKRTLMSWEYAPVCDVVYERSKLFNMCLEDVDLCPDVALDKLDRMITDAEPLGKKLLELRPYMSNVFSDNPVIKDTCFLGGEEVPCLSTQ